MNGGDLVFGFGIHTPDVAWGDVTYTDSDGIAVQQTLKNLFRVNSTKTKDIASLILNIGQPATIEGIDYTYICNMCYVHDYMNTGCAFVQYNWRVPGNAHTQFTRPSDSIHLQLSNIVGSKDLVTLESSKYKFGQSPAQ